MNVRIIYVVLINVFAFLIYGVDKWNAKHELRRIPEKTLLGFACWVEVLELMLE